jgi:N-acetylglucosaminyldiphosphoundecaprenol N-acetyl-beta-D-mannosaminyltransferase
MNRRINNLPPAIVLGCHKMGLGVIDRRYGRCAIMKKSNTEYQDIEKVHFMGVKIDNVSFGDVHEFIRGKINKNAKGYICVNDVCNVIGASRDRQFLEAVNSASLTIADGTPLTWYARLLGCRKIERISGMDMMVRMFAEDDGFRHFLLGDTDERISRVIERAREINGSIQISGYSPPFKEFDKEDNRLLTDRLNMEGPDIIWVSFGGEKQEKWMFDNIDKLDRGVMIGVGAAFKFLIGELKTPPRMLQKMGLQWVWRTVQVNLEDPKKYLKITINKYLKRRIIFACHFPGEVIRARRKYRGIADR